MNPDLSPVLIFAGAAVCLAIYATYRAHDVGRETRQTLAQMDARLKPFETTFEEFCGSLQAEAELKAAAEEFGLGMTLPWDDAHLELEAEGRPNATRPA